MNLKLLDSALPPGAIVEKFDDGGARRNDGAKLMSAAANPWYVLATIAGEQDNVDGDLHARNRRYWNGWVCRDIQLSERRALAKNLNLPEAELAPLSDDEMEALKKRFRAAFPNETPEDKIPHAGENAFLSGVYFRQTFNANKFVFWAGANFHEAHFAGPAIFIAARFANAVFITAHFAEGAIFHKADFEGGAIFNEAHFTEYTNFRAAHFANDAIFSEAHFAGDADFNRSHFSGDAIFNEANFAGNASFDEAHFARDADFNTTYFAGHAYFSDGIFKAKTDFRMARFKTRVPEFYQRNMHQDTRFTEDKGAWPPVTENNAGQGKQAYNRLRQIASGNHNPDLEHFFLRQEMRCKEVMAKGLDRGGFAFYRLISDSGISVVRPAAALLIMWLVPGLMYLLTYASQIIEGCIAMSPLGPFGLSFANLFSFLGLNRLYFAEITDGFGTWLSLIAGLQSVAGVVLLFFLGLGLRNRFRLK